MHISTCALNNIDYGHLRKLLVFHNVTHMTKDEDHAIRRPTIDHPMHWRRHKSRWVSNWSDCYSLGTHRVLAKSKFLTQVSMCKKMKSGNPSRWLAVLQQHWEWLACYCKFDEQVRCCKKLALVKVSTTDDVQWWRVLTELCQQRRQIEKLPVAVGTRFCGLWRWWVYGVAVIVTKAATCGYGTKAIDTDTHLLRCKWHHKSLTIVTHNQKD